MTCEQAMKQFEEHRKAAQESGANVHEWGVASPENFIVGMIRVYSGNSWFKCLALEHPSRTGSSGFPGGSGCVKVGAWLRFAMG